MKFIGMLSTLFVLLTSFQLGADAKGTDPKNLTFDQVEVYVQGINALRDKKKLTMHTYEGKTAWGSLVSFWGKDDLVMAESIDRAEAGFISSTVYFNGGEICRVVCKNHRANWAQYERDHGNEEYDESKLTYTDEHYDYTFGKETTFRILKDGQMVSSEINQAALDETLFSAQRMQKFMEEEL